MRGDPWGANAHSALLWAYGLLARSASMPNIFGEMSGGGTRVRTEMTMLDHRAQGAMIRSIVARSMVLDETADGERRMDVAHDMVVAYYLPRPVRERVAGGKKEMIDRFAELRVPAVSNLAWWLLGQHGTGVHNVRAMMEMVVQYTIRKGSARKLARLMRIGVENALAARERGFQLLDEQRQRALGIAEDALTQAGLIQPSETPQYQMG